MRVCSVLTVLWTFVVLVIKAAYMYTVSQKKVAHYI